MGICSRCFCDPYKLTYVSAIVTSIEAVGFGVLNIVLICMYQCVIPPPADKPAIGFDKFWAYYFFDNTTCISAVGSDYKLPDWVNVMFPLQDRSLTTPQDNFIYQAIYLGLHAAWLITAIILIYGNARKKWGFYLPWLLVSIAITVMDVTISAFCIQDLVTVTYNDYHSAMFWILALYFRLFIFWFMNLSEMASAFNAFCKTCHKRNKQERQRQKMAKAHAKELAHVEAAAEARTRAQIEQQQLQQQQQYLNYQEQLSDQQQQQQPQPPRRKIPPPVPKKPAAPPESRPFSYLNPAYRPNDPTDLEGMRAHSSPAPDIHPQPFSIPQSHGPYFPSDSYDKPRNMGGLPGHRESVRNYHTQERPPALRRSSSTHGYPRNPANMPREPLPDYDHTHRFRPPPSNTQNIRVNPSRGGPFHSNQSVLSSAPDLYNSHDPRPPVNHHDAEKSLYYV